MTVFLANTPVLTTERLRSARPKIDDFAPMKAFFASDRAKFIGGRGHRPTPAWNIFAHAVGMWALRGLDVRA